jgi:hypothetical protein
VVSICTFVPVKSVFALFKQESKHRMLVGREGTKWGTQFACFSCFTGTHKSTILRMEMDLTAIRRRMLVGREGTKMRFVPVKSVFVLFKQ